MQLLSPPLTTKERRRSSVMFSDVVLLHGDNITSPQTSGPTGLFSSSPANNNQQNNLGERNVCSSEKMTQTGRPVII